MGQPPNTTTAVLANANAPQQVTLWLTGAGSATPAPEPFWRVGHSLFALLIALVGGLVARHFHATREEAR